VQFLASWADLEKKYDLDDRFDSFEHKIYLETDLFVDRRCVLGRQIFSRQMCCSWRRQMYLETDVVYWGDRSIWKKDEDRCVVGLDRYYALERKLYGVALVSRID